MKYKTSSYIVSSLAYFMNFKVAVMLVSEFAGLKRFSGDFTAENWAQFNIFGGLYIFLVYAPFALDFYEYFTEFGLRNITSYVAIEAVVIMTMIALCLLLEII